MSGYDLVQAVTWTEGVCQELGIFLLKNGPIQCYMDNKSAIALANTPVFHKRTKHIRIKYHIAKLQLIAHCNCLQFIVTQH
jgi:hypothetical protein